jgi:hypothetical protein
MPTIKLTDQFGLDVDVAPDPLGALSKYFKTPLSVSILKQDIAKVQNVALRDFPFKKLSLGLWCEQPVDIGATGADLTVGAGLSGSLEVLTDGALFEDDPYGGPIQVPQDHAYVAFGLKAAVNVDVSNEPADLDFGFSVGNEISLTNYKLFSTTPTDPTVAQALAASLRDFRIPGDIEDLENLPAGTVVTIDGTGTLKFSGTASLASALNPLATVSSPVLPGGLSVAQGGSIKVGGSFEILGNYQIRVQKTDGKTIRLGYYKRRGCEYRIKATAETGITAGLGGFDLVSLLLKAISKDPKADVDELVKAGLNPEQVSEISSAVKAGVERGLQIALTQQLESLSSTQAAFLYEIDLGSLDAAGRKAIHDALDSNLSALVNNEAALPRGITLVRSIFTSLREAKHVLKINLLGIYNYVSVSDLTLKGTIVYEPASGSLVITDSATAARIRSAAINFGADSQKLRRVLAESFLITAAYRGSKLLVEAPELGSTCWYFELHAKTNQQTMKDNLDIAQALGLLTAQQKQEQLHGIDDFGRSMIYAEATFGDELAASLFLDQGGRPRSRDEYENLGRTALQLLVQEGDPDDYRRRPAIQDDLWKKMKDAGQPNFKPLFPDLTGLQVEVISSDYTLIVWWAQVMRQTGEILALIRNFFARTPSVDPENNTFKMLRAQLADHLAAVAKSTKDQFGDPWGLVVMDLTGGQKSQAAVRVTSPRLALQLERPASAVARLTTA